MARGLRTTSSPSWPAAANKPINPGLRIVPAVASTSPFLLSKPAGRISCPSFTSPLNFSPSTVAISHRIIPSVLSGITAPVAIFTAVPALRAPFIGAPAFTSPTMFQGPAPHTAYPSMADVGNVGSSTSAIASFASVRSTHKSKVIFSEGNCFQKLYASLLACSQ